MGAPVSHPLRRAPLSSPPTTALPDAPLQLAVRSHAHLFIVGWEWLSLIFYRSFSGPGMKSRSDQVNVKVGPPRRRK